MRAALHLLASVLLLMIPVLIVAWLWMHPLGALAFGGHDRLWWIDTTPRCWGPVCLNVWGDHSEITLRVPWPWP